MVPYKIDFGHPKNAKMPPKRGQKNMEFLLFEAPGPSHKRISAHDRPQTPQRPHLVCLLKIVGWFFGSLKPLQ